MVELIGILSQLNPISVLVLGDFMLDTYTTGKVKRISPEAPVSVLLVEKEESRPGGAGNVVLNLLSLGASVFAMGRVGDDLAGETIRASLEREGADVSSLVIQNNFKTPVKNRLIADSQQVLRVDTETPLPLPEIFEMQLLASVKNLLNEVKILAISDYGKGFLSRHFLQTVIQLASERSIPVIVDPKGSDFSKYRGATVIKPNVGEVYAAASLSMENSLDIAAGRILKQCEVKWLLVTRSESGISLYNQFEERFDFPVRLKEVKDVTGAGDTVLAIISLALANNIDIKKAAQMANIAAGIAIEKLGCAQIKLSELAERLLEFDVENKVFDQAHLFALQQALKGKSYIVLGISSHEGMSTALFRSLRTLSSKYEPEKKLILYIRNQDPDEEFVSMLASLSEVDFIVLKCESLKDLCDVIEPSQVHLLQGDHLQALDHSTALLARQ